LLNRGYSVGHYHLNPTQVGIPNDRERYYCVAVLVDDADKAKPSSSSSPSSCLWTKMNFEKLPSPSLSPQELALSPKGTVNPPQENPLDSSTTTNLLKAPSILKSILILGIEDEINSKCALRPLSVFLDKDLPPLCAGGGVSSAINESKLESIRIPEKLFNSDAAWCFDIVSVSSKKNKSNASKHDKEQEQNVIVRPTACFTHSYGKFARGAGSILYTGIDTDKDFSLQKPEERQFDRSWKEGTDRRDLRYFSGTEIARLMGFPVLEDENGETETSTSGAGEKQHSATAATSFRFPPTCTIKNQWKLLGNSLNVQVASRVVELGLMVLIDAESL
jgi:site-specific DNA-cytosine methylase